MSASRSASPASPASPDSVSLLLDSEAPASESAEEDYVSIEFASAQVEMHAQEINALRQLHALEITRLKSELLETLESERRIADLAERLEKDKTAVEVERLQSELSVLRLQNAELKAALVVSEEKATSAKTSSLFNGRTTLFPFMFPLAYHKHWATNFANSSAARQAGDATSTVTHTPSQGSSPSPK
jgi:hypothetical protein